MSEMLIFATEQLYAPNWWNTHPAATTGRPLARGLTFSTDLAKARIATIMDYVQEEQRKVSVADVAAHLDCHITTAADYLNHLYAQKQLERGRDPKNYRQFAYWIASNNG